MSLLAWMVCAIELSGVTGSELRARAFFDTWKEKYPKYTFDRMSWAGM